MNLKRKCLTILILFATLQGALLGQSKELADYVNTYIGSISPKTGGTSPLVRIPHGEIEIAPAFTPGIGDQYLADKIFAFRFGIVNIMANTGEIKLADKNISSRFDHDLETATPYYYSVLLEDFNIKVEYTVNNNSAYFRFTFPKSEKSNLFLALNGKASLDIKNGKEIEGSSEINYNNFSYDIQKRKRVFYCAEFSAPFSASGTWQGDKGAIDKKSLAGERIGAFATYSTRENGVIEVKISFSDKSIDEARSTLDKEMPGWNFEAAKSTAKELWNKSLGLIKVEGGTEEQKTIFYSALYRTMGMKGNVWDTYRCAYPLQTIIEPEEDMKAINEFIKIYNETGWLPSSGAMIGNHSTSVIVDAYMKGLRNFDVNKAYEGMKKNHMEATMVPWRDKGHITELEKCYFEKGYYPALDVKEHIEEPCSVGMPYQIKWLPEVGVNETVKEVDGWHRRQSVSVTLEHSYDDWCLAQLAKALGKNEDYEYFIKRAHNYQNLWNPKIGFMAPKTAEGKWVEPFDPKLSGGFAGEGYFAEGNAWINTWQVQHDVQGLISLMGGREKFIDKLNALFVEQYGMDKPAFIGQFPDMTGLMGQYCQGNEPSFHIPFLYNYAGQPWMTQRRVREIMKLWYNATPFGLSGDDDHGAMSSWYVFNAMGFYPECPGRPIYDIGSPIFSKITLNVGGGKEFTIEAKNASDKNKYIQSATLNGKTITKAWIEHSDIVKGGNLTFEMGDRPNKAWGSRPEDAAPSMTPVAEVK
ncbi:MAG: GH92 family glycosyl hydrolase [Bacteroidota bacterium]|nr:GH92 family glycosyl hydrolase [Bacteroidota bacterium]MDP4196288.1 GH92 family glycosyl hydrolase [Bacteroidota bacterium]